MKNLPRAGTVRPKAASRSKSFYYSILLHTALILAVVIGIDWESTSVMAPAPATKVMNATAIDSKQVAAEVQKLKRVEQKKLAAEQQRQREAEERVKQEQDRLDKLKTEQAEVKRQKEQENRQLEAEKVQLKKEREEAALQKKKAEAEKLKVEEEARKAQAAEKQRAEEAEAKRKAEAETKRKAEAEKARLAEEKRKQDEAKAEAALKEAMAAEEAEQAAAAQVGQDTSELARYQSRIKSAIENEFVQPLGLPDGLKCTLFVRVIPGGEVIESRVIQSSGNPVFDKQAENAVLKASPLPVPDAPRLFNEMREFNFVFDPES